MKWPLPPINGIKMIQSDIHHSDIHNSDLHNADMHNRDLHNADMHNRDLHNRNLHNGDIEHNEKHDDNDDIGAINRNNDLSGLEERKLEIDEDRNQSSIMEDEDRYQLPDTQNQELRSEVYREDRRPVDVPVSIHIPEDRVGPVVGEPPQLHVNEMSSTVSSPGRSCKCFI